MTNRLEYPSYCTWRLNENEIHLLRDGYSSLYSCYSYGHIVEYASIIIFILMSFVVCMNSVSIHHDYHKMIEIVILLFHYHVVIIAWKDQEGNERNHKSGYRVYFFFYSIWLLPGVCISILWIAISLQEVFHSWKWFSFNTVTFNLHLFEQNTRVILRSRRFYQRVLFIVHDCGFNSSA